MIGLLVDNAEELVRLARVQRRRGVQQGGGRTLDGGERRAQLVTDHAQELRPQPVQFLQLRQVLHGNHYRIDYALCGTDRRDVKQRGDTPAVRNR